MPDFMLDFVLDHTSMPMNTVEIGDQYHSGDTQCSVVYGHDSPSLQGFQSNLQVFGKFTKTFI